MIPQALALVKVKTAIFPLFSQDVRTRSRTRLVTVRVQVCDCCRGYNRQGGVCARMLSIVFKFIALCIIARDGKGIQLIKMMNMQYAYD